MRYSIRWAEKAKDQLRKLPQNVREQITRRVTQLSIDPRPIQSKQLKGKGNPRSLRSGDYRILYQVRDKVLVVLVIRVAHRKDVYRNLQDLED